MGFFTIIQNLISFFFKSSSPNKGVIDDEKREDVIVVRNEEQITISEPEVIVEKKPINEVTIIQKKNEMKVIDQFLGKGEYFEEVHEKTIFYLHHTAGGHRPDWVIQGWDTDDKIDPGTGKPVPYPIATAYVIGGLSTRDPKDVSFDGKIYRCFDDKYWAHHLGTNLNNNRALNRNSVAVEICNYGPLRKGNDGKFYTYVNSVVPPNMVIELDKPFRGFKFYHKYTDKQIEATKELILEMKKKYPKIELRTPLLTEEGFEFNIKATQGVSGIFSHSNVRRDKFDVFPQPNLIAMLKEICSPL